ncbi:hypothetical protein Nocox_23715 [Nonomuraea coxensis DSM 45129]|uniref:Integral membrane protein n=1 Tax=Nonomuraea coxensis DSM 45129 TaxID=1122611 RepID=A0ABX8U625_9ACTN|nr:hypothetical protein [Nonomuraea coxensis]QYC42346.1 hypothetical protein Nocox_23715 [Nonomuraea coxensis DSM 45129]
MTDERTDGQGVRVRPADVRQAGDWLARHGLGGTPPTPLLAARLAARTLLEAWVRRVDRRAGAALARRAAHPVQPGWRALLGRPYAVCAAATHVAALALACGALTVDDAAVRNAALVLLVALAGVGAIAVLQVRDLLARPVVAEDEASLTADVIMRIEDARESTAPGTVWALPMVMLFGTAPVWWSAAALGLVLLGLAALVAVQARTPGSAAMARRIVSLG